MISVISSFKLRIGRIAMSISVSPEASTLSKAEMELVRLRFVNITGLPYDKISTGDEDDGGFVSGIIQAPREQYGRFGNHRDKWIVVTVRGRVWISIREIAPPMKALFDAAPKGNGAYVFCGEEGELLNFADLLARVSNPLAVVRDRCLPDPQY